MTVLLHTQRDDRAFRLTGPWSCYKADSTLSVLLHSQQDDRAFTQTARRLCLNVYSAVIVLCPKCRMFLLPAGVAVAASIRAAAVLLMACSFPVPSFLKVDGVYKYAIICHFPLGL